MREPRQHFFESQRLRLAYWSWGAADPGDEDRAPLLLVHGGRDHSRSWDHLAGAFADDYHVVAYDLRGHGDSQWALGSHYGLTDHVLDLIALIDVLGDRATVVGHSLGGLVTSLAAGIFPERFARVVAIEGAGARVHRRPPATPVALREWAERARGFERRHPRIYPSIDAGARRMREANPRLTPKLATHLATHGMRHTADGYVWKFDNWVEARAPVEIREDEARAIWGEATCPVLLVMGGESAASGQHRPEDASFFRDARAVVIDDAGHWAHHDQPIAVLDAISGFLGG